jgi:four helix bundle protein
MRSRSRNIRSLRVREEDKRGYDRNSETLNVARLKKTPNAERRTSNAERKVFSVVLHELSVSQYGQQTRRKYDLEDRLLEFAVQVIELTEALPNTRAANHLAGQLLRSGTSPYGNHGELESAESRKDFIHKLKICLNELRETRRWLRLLTRLKTFKRPTVLPACLNESEELIRIFVSSVRTAERNSA